MVVNVTTLTTFRRLTEVFIILNSGLTFFFALLLIGQWIFDKKRVGEREGNGSGKVHEAGFELGTPEVIDADSSLTFWIS